MLAVNEILQNRYRIVRALGRGGMGAVYEAIDERFGTPVALKEILVELHDADQKHKSSMVKAFEREAKSLAQARHEAVPFVRDYFSELNRQFLVMELVEGDDLAELLEKRGAPFPLEDILNWADQLLDALDYLHNLQPPIIHRDIKPQNLKLSFRRKIKLLDFGIAKSGDGGTATLTNQTFVGATLNYSPIEQILPVIDPAFREFIKLKHREKTEAILSQNTDLRCDIYALGATFYHLLTDHPPLDSTTRTLEIWEGKPDPLPNPSTLNPAIPRLISECLLKALEIERANRFASAVEMQTALQKLTFEERSRSKDLSSVSAENNLYTKTSLHSTKLLPVPPTEPQLSVPDTLVGETLDEKVPDTLPFGGFSKSRPPATAPLDAPPVYENDFHRAAQTTADSKPAAKLFWLVPTAAVCIVAVGGIGAMIWRNGAALTDANKSAANAVIAAPSATAAGLPPFKTDSPTKITPDSPPLPTPNISNKKDENTKSAIAPAPIQKPSPNPSKTSPPPKPPKPAPTRQNTGDDCIYNGKCS